MAFDNPYQYLKPIHEPGCFYGRPAAVNNTLNLLSHLQSLSLIGPPSIGKTSMLHYIAHPDVLRKFDLDSNQYIFIYLDGKILRGLSQADFYRRLLDETRACILQAGLEIAFSSLAEQTPITYSAFFDELEAITYHDLKLIFLFDAFESISQNEALDAAFFTGLRAIAGNLEVAYVTASEHNLFDLTYTEDMLGSPFFNIFTTIRIGLFDQNETYSLITEPSSAAGITFSAETVDFIVTLAGHHPLFIQTACFYAFNRQSQKGSLDQDDYTWLRRKVETALAGRLN